MSEQLSLFAAPTSAAPSITIANFKHNPKILDQPGAVYIGRGMPKYALPPSPLLNPFKIGQEGTRSEVCDRYVDRVLNPAIEAQRGEVWDEIKWLSDRVRRGEKLTLVCWCVEPYTGVRCHGFDVAAAVMALAKEEEAQPQPDLEIAILSL